MADVALEKTVEKKASTNQFTSQTASGVKPSFNPCYSLVVFFPFSRPSASSMSLARKRCFFSRCQKSIFLTLFTTTKWQPHTGNLAFGLCSRPQ